MPRAFKPSLFTDLDAVPGIALDPRFAGLVRLAALGYPGKRTKTRGCSTGYRGAVVICATSGEGTKDNRRFERCFEDARIALVGGGLVPAGLFAEVTSIRGAAVAIATIADTRSLVEADWPTAFFTREGGERRLAWPLTNLWPVAPFGVRPQASLFFRVPAIDVVLGLAEWVARAARAPSEDADLYPSEIERARRELRESDLPGLGARWGHLR